MDARKWRLAGVLLLLVLVASVFYFPIVSQTSPWRPVVESVSVSPTSDARPVQELVDYEAQEHDAFSIHLHAEKHVNRKPQTIELEWNITQDIRRPDGVASPVYLIDEQFPGPTVECRSGDEIIVTVHNQLENESIALHWHGLRVPNDMDGVAGLTQCPTLPGRSFTYHFSVPTDQSGTYWYYSTSALQRADGLFGAFVVHKPVDAADGGSESESREYGYVDDQVLMIGDWYHSSGDGVFGWYTDVRNNAVDPTPDSLLLNGRGYFDCSTFKPGRSIDCEAVEIPRLRFSSRRARLRIVNTGSLTSFTISVSGYSLTAVQVDGGGRVGDTRTAAKEVGPLHSGERIDLIVEHDHEGDEGLGWLTVSLHRDTMQLMNLALTSTQQFPIVAAMASDRNLSPVAKMTSTETKRQRGNVDLTRITGARNFPAEWASVADMTVLFYTAIQASTSYLERPKGLVNGSSWLLSDTTRAPLIAMDRQDWSTDLPPPALTIQDGDWVDIVLNNFDDKSHPFHLHGHQFYVLSVQRPFELTAHEFYNPFNEVQPAPTPLNLHNPVLKDVVHVPRMGFAVLRFKADNPGLWLLQCHTLWHQAIGMGLVVEVLDNSPEAFRPKLSEKKASCD